MFAKERRIRKEGEFKNVLERGRFVATPLFLLKYKKASEPESRFGFVVSRKVSPKATVRNTVKRRLREIARREEIRLPVPCDVVVIARRAAASASFGELRESFVAALNQART